MDFGQKENQRLKDRFDAFVKTKRPNFAQDIHSRKVLVSGFGLFKGIESNITTTITQALGDPDFFDRSQDLNQAPLFPLSQEIPRGDVRAEHGVDVHHRRLFLSGMEIELLILGIDVQWDFASAVIAHEIQRTQPDAVLMMGQGKDKIVLEKGALNQGSKLSGFDQFGIGLEGNTVSDKALIPEAPAVLPMTWPNELIAENIRVTAEALGFEVESAQEARPNNTYICNQVSYTSLLLAQEKGLSLAGGEIEISPGMRSPQSIGFLHLPQRERIESKELSLWLQLVTQVIYHMLPDLSSEAAEG